MLIQTRRILIAVALLSGIGVATLAGSIAATAGKGEVDPGPMRDRVIETLHNGVPADVVRRRERVLAELAQKPADAWAAEYYEGDGLGENVTLSLAPTSGVSATWFGCLGLYGSNEGEVERVDEHTLAFHFNRPNDDRFAKFPESVRVVRWGERRYLVPDEEMGNFVSAINRNMEPSKHGFRNFLLARDDENKSVSGLPDLPAQWVALIRRTPLVVRVTSVEALGPRDLAGGGVVCPFRLKFDVPDGEKLLPGIQLDVMDDPQFQSASVDEVAAHEATATLVDYPDEEKDCASLGDERPEIGWTLSTGAYDPAASVAKTNDG